MYEDQILTWYPVAQEPETQAKCLVHALNQYYVVAAWNNENKRFIDKDGQPVVAGIEWAYLFDRSES